MTTLKLDAVRACVFDAYGTLFDVTSAARSARDAQGDNWQPVADLWRTKQLQYTWLRGLAGHHADFWQVTGDALDFALAALEINRPGLRERLMNLYLGLSAYPEVPDTLRRLKAGGMRLAILSNGTPTMLAAAVANAGIAELFDAVLSVEEVRGALGGDGPGSGRAAAYRGNAVVISFSCLSRCYCRGRQLSCPCLLRAARRSGAPCYAAPASAFRNCCSRGTS